MSPRQSRASHRMVNAPELLSRTNAWDPATVTSISGYLETNYLAMERAARALNLPRCRYPMDFSFGPDTLVPHLGKLKELALAAGLRSALAARQGSNRWPEDVQLQLKLAGTLDAEPMVISFLARAAIIQTAVRATEHNLNNGPALQSEPSQKLQEAFLAVAQTNLLPVALIGERAINIPSFRLSRQEIKSFREGDDLQQTHKRQRYSGKGTEFSWVTGFFERDLNFFLKTMQNSIDRASQPWPARWQLANDSQATWELAARRYYILSSMLLPAFSRVEVRAARLHAGVVLAATALAIERFRQARGHLPVQLNELVPDFIQSVPMDPFDGAAIKYRRLDKGYVLYSVDEDGRDDGGREVPARKKPEDKNSYDITFTVEH